MLILELLGDIGAFHDRFLHADSGEISFHQMCYYIFVTISTVGYGDFAPTSILGRTFVLIVILGGSMFKRAAEQAESKLQPHADTRVEA